MPTQLETFTPANILQPVKWPADARQDAASFLPSLTVPKGTILGKKSFTSEVDTVAITGTPTGGTFTLTVAGQVATIAYNATLAAAQAAVAALSTVGIGNVTVTGTPASSYVFTFSPLLGNLTVTSSGAGLTGGSSPAATNTETTAGVANAGKLGAYASGNSDGTQTALAIAMYSFTTDANGKCFVSSDTSVASHVAVPLSELPVWVAGTFDPAELVGLDGTAVTALKARYTHDGYLRIP